MTTTARHLENIAAQITHAHRVALFALSSFAGITCLASSIMANLTAAIA